MGVLNYVQSLATLCMFSTSNVHVRSVVRYDRLVWPAVVHYFWGVKLYPSLTLAKPYQNSTGYRVHLIKGFIVAKVKRWTYLNKYSKHSTDKHVYTTLYFIIAHNDSTACTWECILYISVYKSYSYAWYNCVSSYVWMCTMLQDVRVKRGTEAEPDHDLMIAKLQLKLKKCNAISCRRIKYNV